MTKRFRSRSSVSANNEVKPADLPRRLKEVEAENTQLRLKLAKVKVCIEYFGSTESLVFLDILRTHLK